MEKKKCTKCGQIKNVDEFYTRLGKSSTRCKSCENESKKEYNTKHPDKQSRWNTQWRMRNPIEAWALDTLYKHDKKGYKIEISNEQLVSIAKLTPRCEICGLELKWRHEEKNGKISLDSPTLDRLHSNDVINKDNIQIICLKCNTTKHNRSMDEFIDYCENVLLKFRPDLLKSL